MRKTKFISFLAGLLVLAGCNAPAKPAEPTAEPVQTPSADVEEPIVEQTEEHEFNEIAVFGLDDGTDGDKKTSADAIVLAAIDYDANTINTVSPSRELLTEDLNLLGDAYITGQEKGELAAINKAFDLDFKKYISVDYKAIETVVDEVGGIEIELTDEEIRQTNHPLNITGNAGTYTLDGKQAVAYCRIVKIDSEKQRAARIASVVEAITKKIDNASLAGIVAKVFPYVHTNLRADEMLQLATDVMDFKNDAVISNFVPEDGIRTNGGIIVEDYGKLAEEVHEKLYGGFRPYEKSEGFAKFETEIQEALKKN